jgi:hypothetical protein
MIKKKLYATLNSEILKSEAKLRSRLRPLPAAFTASLREMPVAEDACLLHAAETHNSTTVCHMSIRVQSNELNIETN